MDNLVNDIEKILDKAEELYIAHNYYTIEKNPNDNKLWVVGIIDMGYGPDEVEYLESVESIIKKLDNGIK